MITIPLTLNVSVPVYELAVNIGEAVSLQTVSPVVVTQDTVPVWDGSTEFVSSDSDQIIPVHGYRFTEDIVIDKIPSNYGLITWNGVTLTVS